MVSFTVFRGIIQKADRKLCFSFNEKILTISPNVFRFHGDVDWIQLALVPAMREIFRFGERRESQLHGVGCLATKFEQVPIFIWAC